MIEFRLNAAVLSALRPRGPAISGSNCFCCLRLGNAYSVF